jgi:hypothetical protein
MAEPARRNAAGPAVPEWADLRRQAAVAIAAIVADPGSGLAVGVLRDLCDIARREIARCQRVDETVIALERARAVAEDRAARRRGRLRAV